jgi:DNA repair protein RecN (Recombination protein N)
VLARLVIQNIVLIDKLALTLGAGLNVFTGETGAGKSIVLDALGLALGGRSDAGLIRNGAAQASVIAEFSSLPPVLLAKLAEENGLEIDEPVLLRRVVANDGKSRAFINDQPISIALLKKIGEELLEIHGQFETHGLLNPATHRGLLDAFGNYETLRKKVAESYTTWRKAAADYAHAAQERERAKSEEDFLLAAVAELDELAPEIGETERLAEWRMSLQHREKILEALQTATHLIDGENGATAALAGTGKALARVADKAAGLADILANIDRLSNEVVEAGQQLASYASDIDANPDDLQRIEERLFALRAVARKHGVTA